MERLTLTEYRKENAIALSNDKIVKSYDIYDAEHYILRKYLDYLFMYGIDKEIYHKLFTKIMSQPIKNPLTSEEIEEIISCH